MGALRWPDAQGESGPTARSARSTDVNVDSLLQHWGYWAVFLLVGAESLGIPLPGETILIAAGIYAGTTHKLSIWGIWLAAIAGAIIGDNIGFTIGRQGGYRIARRYGHYVRFDEAKLKVGMYVFDRHGGKVVFFGRFVSVLRTYAAFLAGTNRMKWRRFLFWNASGAIVWASVYSFGSYLAGNAIKNASKTANYALAALAVIAIVAAILIVRKKVSQLEATAEEAFPGQLPDR
jgi:membrane protein DedA with SNARE-associated domain